MSILSLIECKLTQAVRNVVETEFNRDPRHIRISAIYEKMRWSPNPWWDFLGIVSCYRKWAITKMLDFVENQEKNRQYRPLIESIVAGREKDEDQLFNDFSVEGRYKVFTEADLRLAIAVVKGVAQDQQKAVLKVPSWSSFEIAARTYFLVDHPIQPFVKQIEEMDDDRLDAILERVESGEGVARGAEPLLRAALMFQMEPFDLYKLSDKARNALTRFMGADRGFQGTLRCVLERRIDQREFTADMISRFERSMERNAKKSVENLREEYRGALKGSFVRVSIDDDFDAVPILLAVDSRDAVNPALGQLLGQPIAPVIIDLSKSTQHVEIAQDSSAFKTVVQTIIAPLCASDADRTPLNETITSSYTYTFEKTGGEWRLMDVVCEPVVQLHEPVSDRVSPNLYDPVRDWNKPFVLDPATGQLMVVEAV